MKKCHILGSGGGQDRGPRAYETPQNGPWERSRGTQDPLRGASAALKREVKQVVAKC